MADETVPRKPVETSPEAQIWASLNEMAKAITEMQRASPLRNASISGGSGIRLLTDPPAEGQPGRLRIWINPDGTITAYDIGTGEPAVRMGRMVETGGQAGNTQYGIEVKVGAQWVQLGNQTVTWNNIQGKPSTFPTSAHTHPGSQVTSTVAAAFTAGDADHANLADGSQYAFNNTVSGNTFYAVWVGNDGGFHLGRNVSSRRFKENIREVPGVDKDVLKVKVCTFTRKGGGPADEYGVIAEQAHEHFPQATQFFEGQIDGVRYELYGAALIPIVNEHEDRLTKLERLVEEQAAELAELRELLE